MFVPIAPIQSDSRFDVEVDSILARVDALATVLHALGRMAGAAGSLPVQSLNQRANLSARLAGRDPLAVAHLACELDAVAAALQAGFAALDRARNRGQRANAAAALLHREAGESLSAILGAISEDVRVS